MPHQTGDAHVRDLIARAVQAKGGLEKLRSIKTIKATSTATVLSRRGGEVEMTSFIRYPNAFRVDMDTGGGPVVQVYNDGEYWIQDGRGVRSPPDSILAQIEGTVQRDVIRLLLALSDGRVGAMRLPDVVHAGRSLPAIRVSEGGMKPVTLILDPKTYRILAERYETQAGDGGWTLVEEQFSDYRNVKGLQVAFTATVLQGGIPFLNRRVRAFDYNLPLDAALFIKPS